MSNPNDIQLTTLLRQRARAKVTEISEIQHDLKRLEVQQERAKKYLARINEFLEAEGQAPERLKESPTGGSIVGRAGNRAKDYPVRKTEWEGMTLFEAVSHILEASPNDILHADLIAHKIYEIQTTADLRRVKQSLVSTLRQGVKKDLWEGLGGNKYKAKAPTMRRLVPA